MELVGQVLTAKAADPTADTLALEQQIDALVAELYGLTPAEVALLAGTSPPNPLSSGRGGA